MCALGIYDPDMNLNKYVPKNKHDHAAVQRARAVGFPALDPVLPNLLGWLKDMNWPVADAIAELLSISGAEIVPHIRGAFRSDDAIWKYWILTQLCPKLSPVILAELRSDIEKLATNATPSDRIEDVDAAATDLLSSTFNRED
jgi:hypothetical protein